MKTINWIKWLVVLLLIVNFSAIATIIYTQKQEAGYEESLSAPLTTESDESMRYSGRWFRDELQLTGNQMREFSRFNPVFRQRVKHINTELNSARQQMLGELSAEKSDTALLNSLSESIGDLHSELKKVTYAYYLEFKSICTPDQQIKLHAIFDRMFEGEIPARGPGRGMQGGGRFGMRWRNNHNTN